MNIQIANLVSKEPNSEKICNIFILYLEGWIDSLASEPEMEEMKIEWQELKELCKKKDE